MVLTLFLGCLFVCVYDTEAVQPFPKPLAAADTHTSIQLSSTDSCSIDLASTKYVIGTAWCKNNHSYEAASWGSWRSLVSTATAGIMYKTRQKQTNQIAMPAQVRLTDIYEFGVFNGKSMKDLRRSFPEQKMWGFDSFEGLPQDTDAQQKLWNAAWASHWDNAFLPGRYHSKPDVTTSLIRDLGGSDRVGFIPGYYSESLTPSLSVEHGMNPALFIDIDADLYISTRQALDWVFSSGLAQVGTVIGYDDFWVPACIEPTDSLTAVHPLEAGEGLAHAEVARKHAVTFACLAGSCARPRLANPYDWSHGCDVHNSWSPLFVVAGFGEANTGFEMSQAHVDEFLAKNRDCESSRWNSHASHASAS